VACGRRDSVDSDPRLNGFESHPYVPEFPVPNFIVIGICLGAFQFPTLLLWREIDQQRFFKEILNFQFPTLLFLYKS
jgi:hypothetical protein